MPSPFPGMDPYLEGVLWTTLHHGLGTEIVRQLAPKLRPNYIALPVERFVMEISPDVSVEIRDTSQRRLVTAIEILSPTNKRGAGNQEYLAKRQRLLLIIDYTQPPDVPFTEGEAAWVERHLHQAGLRA